MEIKAGREPLLELRSLSKSFVEARTGKVLEVLSDVDLRIAPGTFTCLVGPSGCGKTTLLRIIAGLETATAGEVLLEGSPVTGPGPDRGLVFQEYALFPWRTVLKNVTFGPDVSGETRAGAIADARELLETMGLSTHEDLYPRELSGGMKQRVAIARTLAVKPKVLLMDEPFASLDAQARNAMQEFLVELWLRTGATIVFVTHSVDEAVFLGQEVLGLSRRPARIVQRFTCDLAYPRNRTDPGFTALRARILEYLKQELVDDHA
ncbi:MAG: ABC transporter ATP-binding protein [Actinobacteria bacterium]|nr:ABC transporter ATP-binding protein [Actinomycetota bacterium]MBU1942679.1 ABC transporter ATP-binding protein [Actinomycetota bacterium]MBU2686001.1 ABC transporter ATP-binding protein [Actinomycetota bacterium]